MSRKEINKVRYIVACINEFAEMVDLDIQEAFRYLYNYKGIEFIKEYYDVEHTLSLEDTVEDLKLICQKNGGKIV